MDRRRLFGIAAAVAAAVSAPVLAQNFSEGYEFLKGVRTRDGAAIQRMLASPSATVINARESGTGYGALHIVVRNRDMIWLNFFLGRRARVDIQDNEGNTPLATAAMIGWTEGVARRLNAGAAVNAQNNRGETPLIAAVQRRDIVVVRQLLARGADPNHTDSAAGYSAIDYARRDNRSAEILRLLQAQRAPARSTAGPTR